MSGIYIPDMEMPQACSYCPFRACISKVAKKSGIFAALDESAKRNRSDCRPDDCPLVAVPDHGRLIDADVLDKQIYNDIPMKVFGNIARMAEMRNIIYAAPTVIPADKGEEK